MAELNSYSLSRTWFDWCFENPEKINPNHSALYFFCIEHCNRLGWKNKFGLPTTMAKEAIGIRSYNTYINTLNDLVSFGFVELIEKSKNQYSSNIIALSNFNKAPNKALDKALIKHTSKQSESTGESISSIIKQETNNNLTNLTSEQQKSFSPISNIFELTIDECKKQYILDDILIESVCMNIKRTNVEILALLDTFSLKLITEGVQSKTLTDFKSHFVRWAKIQTSIKAMDQSQPALKKKYL